MPFARLAERIAGAPISWGVCEAPDWGIELPAERVLAEMRAVGLHATELGPTGYLGVDPADVERRVHAAGLRLVGGFLPVVLHSDSDLDLDAAATAMQTLSAAGASQVILAAQSIDGSYDRAVDLNDDQWRTLLRNLDRVRQVASDHGLAASLHPHVGTAIADRRSVFRVVADSDIDLCVDTGHLLIGGTEPIELLAVAADRVAHVHLKDVARPLAAAVRNAEISYSAAVRAGLYRALGDGDADIAAVVQALEAAEYQGWYVLEQDAMLSAVPPADGGPIVDVKRSLAFLLGLVPGTPSAP